jgi:hypothetical protein
MLQQVAVERNMRVSKEVKFRARRDEVTGEWKKLHNEELHNLYSSPQHN